MSAGPCTGCGGSGEVCIRTHKKVIAPGAWEIIYEMETCKMCAVAKKRRSKSSAAEATLADAGIEF